MRPALAAPFICLLAAAAAALILARTSLAVGPSLPALDGGAAISTPGSGLSYVVRLKRSSTRLQAQAHGRTVRSLELSGGWGIQLATLGGALTGLSPDGHVLVLSDNVQPNGGLRARSRFAVIDTRALTVEQEITLRGDFSVDALSPSGDLLYLIHHVSQADLSKYQVQAYDLQAGRLLPGVIADKSQSGWVMAGYPVARVATADGGWVYTLYRQDHNYPFIHALDTVHHSAVCIGLPAKWATDNPWISTARFKLSAGKLEVKTNSGETRFVLDTKTFRVTTPKAP